MMKTEGDAAGGGRGAAPGRLRRGFILLFGPGTWRNGLAWAVLILALLAARWALVDQFTIPSGSMEPTLHGDPRWFRGDRVSVNKWVYGLRWPLNQWRVPFTPVVVEYAHERLWPREKPERWDIVVFKSAGEANAGETLIKRVVGLPGERVEIGADGRAVINGEPLDPPEELRGVLDYTRSPTGTDIRRYVVFLAQSGRLPAPDDPDSAVWRRFQQDLAELARKMQESGITRPAEHQMRVLCAHFAEASWHIAATLVDANAAVRGLFRYGILDAEEYTRVPEGHYYLLGDNSGASRDSRAFGWVPYEHILGRAFAIWWPPGRWRDLTGFTDTWWGKALASLYLLPVLVLLYELARFYGVSLHRVRADWPEGGVMGGRWVVAERWPFGIRMPFSFFRLIPGRNPAKGEVVLYAEPPHGGFRGRLLIGRIAAMAGEPFANGRERSDAVIPQGYCAILGPPDQPDSTTFGPVALRRVVGRVRA